MIYTALLISLASLGFRAITGKGMIFYFLRKPFDDISARNKNLQSFIDNESNSKEDLPKSKKLLKRNKSILYIAKPFILCSTCMASIHTLIWFYIIENHFILKDVVLVMLIVALLNTLIWATVEMIQKLTEALQRSIEVEYED